MIVANPFHRQLAFGRLAGPLAARVVLATLRAMNDPVDSIETDTRTMRSPALWLATGLGVGFSPIAPGTLGALWGLPLAWAIGQIGDWRAEALLIGAICLLSVPICTAAARALGGAKDPGAIVLDEIASVPITFFMVPIDSLWVVVVGFALHRLFDVTKPPPIRRLERLPDGLGIMADDWLAGVYSCAMLHLLLNLYS